MATRPTKTEPPSHGIEEDKHPPERRLVIACQGGGALAAYQAGVLQSLLASAQYQQNAADDHWVEITLPLGGGNAPERFRLVGFSGTSGGAQNAAIAWSACATGEPQRAAGRLAKWWESMAVPTNRPFSMEGMIPWQGLSADRFWFTQPFAGWAAQAWFYWAPIFAKDPQLWGNPFSATLRGLFIERVRQELGADLYQASQHAQVPEMAVFLGAIEVMSGKFTVFQAGGAASAMRSGPSLVDKGIERVSLQAEHLVASACLPELFGSTPVRLSSGGDGQFWDGLYSHNPPLGALLKIKAPKQNNAGAQAQNSKEWHPDVILILRINPRETATPPTSKEEIEDRHNELIGNLSLQQEINAIQRINELVLAGRAHGSAPCTTPRQALAVAAAAYYGLTEIHELEPAPDHSSTWTPLSKLNNLDWHIQMLMFQGRKDGVEALNTPQGRFMRLTP